MSKYAVSLPLLITGASLEVMSIAGFFFPPKPLVNNFSQPCFNHCNPGLFVGWEEMKLCRRWLPMGCFSPELKGSSLWGGMGLGVRNAAPLFASGKEGLL